MKIKDGGPAFPSTIQYFPDDKNADEEKGMTLRDHFAGLAMPVVYTDIVHRASVEGWPEDWRYRVAQDAYDMADAMLKARESK
jgi:hypothetical protein